jgi:drug/metabolite transporter (DMT)-like permease
MLGTFIPAFLFAIAQIDSSVSSILNSLTPYPNSWAIAFGVSFQRRQLWGVIIGLIGVYY